MNFEQFFQTATGNTPFPYQTRFATGETLPELVDVPTGIGKTAMAGLGWAGGGEGDYENRSIPFFPVPPFSLL